MANCPKWYQNKFPRPKFNIIIFIFPFRVKNYFMVLILKIRQMDIFLKVFQNIFPRPKYKIIVIIFRLQSQILFYGINIENRGIYFLKFPKHWLFYGKPAHFGTKLIFLGQNRNYVFLYFGYRVNHYFIILIQIIEQRYMFIKIFQTLDVQWRTGALWCQTNFPRPKFKIFVFRVWSQRFFYGINIEDQTEGYIS